MATIQHSNIRNRRTNRVCVGKEQKMTNYEFMTKEIERQNGNLQTSDDWLVWSLMQIILYQARILDELEKMNGGMRNDERRSDSNTRR